MRAHTATEGGETTNKRSGRAAGAISHRVAPHRSAPLLLSRPSSLTCRVDVVARRAHARRRRQSDLVGHRVRQQRRRGLQLEAKTAAATLKASARTPRGQSGRRRERRRVSELWMCQSHLSASRPWFAACGCCRRDSRVTALPLSLHSPRPSAAPLESSCRLPLRCCRPLGRVAAPLAPCSRL